MKHEFSLRCEHSVLTLVDSGYPNRYLSAAGPGLASPRRPFRRPITSVTRRLVHLVARLALEGRHGSDRNRACLRRQLCTIKLITLTECGGSSNRGPNSTSCKLLNQHDFERRNLSSKRPCLSACGMPLCWNSLLREFISEGHFGRHLRRMREIYAERLSILLEESRSRLSGLLEISDVEAGLQTVGWLSLGVSGESVAAAAAKRHLDVIPISAYSHDDALPQEGLQLGFAALDNREIRRGVRELAIALKL
jgi:hypothetical protein